MRKFSYLILVLLLAASMIPSVTAQEAVTEVPEVVMARIQEYGDLIPQLDHYNTIKVEDLAVMLVEEDITILDVREDTEVVETGVIEGAVHIPLRTLSENLNLLPDLDAKIVVVCKGGFRATIAMTALHILGYENAFVLVGGFDAWAGEEMPVVEYGAGEIPATEMPAIDAELVTYVGDYLKNLPEDWGGVKPDILFEESIDNPPDYLLDVRSEEELKDPGYIEGSQWIWVDEFVAKMDEWPAEKDANIVVYCASGYRGGIVSTIMGLMGYTNVRNLAGGVNGWIAGEFPLLKA